ncbi:MAG: hypothetical protein JW969_09595 [Spirochaetales bacterium]|nr:hypothetical protein [Spirochaetales bacterium]
MFGVSYGCQIYIDSDRITIDPDHLGDFAGELLVEIYPPLYLISEIRGISLILKNSTKS